MAFNRQQNVTIAGIEDVSINLLVPGPSNANSTTGVIEIQLKFSDDSIEIVRYDLIARLGDDAEGIAHLSALLELRDYLKTRILAEVLP